MNSIESLTCIHKYLTVCKTDYLSPGFGDWLRGTVTLWNYCQIYNYRLFIDKDVHPIFSYLQENEALITDPITNRDVEEWYYPTTYEEIDEKIKYLFEKNETFAILTNGVYVPLDSNDYYGPISRECKDWLKDILTPNPELTQSIQNVYNTIGINLEQSYRVIHLRLGDNYLHNNVIDDHSYLERINRRIQHTLRTESEYNYILLCDMSSFALELKNRNPQLFYWDNKKIHTGEIRYDKKKVGVQDTLIDFFIMSKAIHIMSIFDSGFSKMVSKIYDITYYRI
jgi:hypothetical protein